MSEGCVKRPLTWAALSYVYITTGLKFKIYTVILLPLGPASLMHKNPQRRKIIHGIRPSGGKERSIDLMIFLLEYPVRVISVAVA